MLRGHEHTGGACHEKTRHVVTEDQQSAAVVQILQIPVGEGFLSLLAEVGVQTGTRNGGQGSTEEGAYEPRRRDARHEEGKPGSVSQGYVNPTTG